MTEVKITAVITKQDRLTEDIYDMRIKAPQTAGEAIPGQLSPLYSRDGSEILPRPISLCGIDREEGELRLVYRIIGAGIKEFSRLEKRDTIDVPRFLGNDFPLKPRKKAFLIGGGIGIPPLLELAKVLRVEQEPGREGGADNGQGVVRLVLGYRNSQIFLKEEFEAYGSVYVATEDGNAGAKGNVLDAIREQGPKADIVHACGPTPIFRALRVYAAEQEMECWLSLKEKIAHGVGICLVCVCQSKDIDRRSQVHNKRICKDGPVFLADRIKL